MDHLLMQSLMSRLHLRSPSSGDSPDSLLLDLFPQLTDDSFPLSGDKEDIESIDLSDDGKLRRTISREEAKLEREIIRIIRSGNADVKLKSNSRQSVSIREHNICIGSHEEAGDRVWEWHDHIMMFDDEEGFTAEYVYGNHFERLQDREGRDEKDVDENEEQRVGCSGLKDLIGDFKDSAANGKWRVLHRNSLNAGSSLK